MTQNPKKQTSTETAVRRQLDAMGGGLFEIGVRSETSGLMMSRGPWTARQVFDALPWLRRQNAQREHVYVRPAEAGRLLLVDDLTPDSLSALRCGRGEPAVVVETSPKNYQAWLRADLPAGLATPVARSLARECAADPNSADARHFGRLAGFTNPKPRHRQPNGLFPFSKLVSATGRASDLADLIEAAEAEQAIQHETEERTGRQCRRRPEGDAFTLFRRHASRISRSNDDQSAVEFGATAELLRAGFSEADAEAVLLACTDVTSRKSGHVEDYVLRTLEAARAAL